MCLDISRFFPFLQDRRTLALFLHLVDDIDWGNSDILLSSSTFQPLCLCPYWRGRFHSLNQAKNLSSESMYIDDAGAWQDPFVGFAPGNVEKMKNIRSTYDPEGVFTRLNRGGFKLGY
jgi:hypothetical protein